MEVKIRPRHQEGVKLRLGEVTSRRVWVEDMSQDSPGPNRKECGGQGEENQQVKEKSSQKPEEGTVQQRPENGHRVVMTQ